MTNTEKLNLKLIDVPEEDEEYFNVDTHLDANWIKIDQFAKDIDTTFNDPNSGVITRLDSEKNQNLNLNPGVSNATSLKNANLKLNTIAGRSLYNLLNRDGDCESTLPWTFTGATASLDTANRLYGSNAIKITLTSTTAKMTKTFPVVNGKRYILIADVKAGSVNNITVSTGALGGNIITSTSYQTSYVLFTASSNSDIQVGLTVNGSSGQIAYVDGIRIYELNLTDYNIAGNSLTPAQIASKYPYTSDFVGVLNPYVIRWDSPSRQNITSMLVFQTELFADPVSGLIPDTLIQTNEGLFIKNCLWKKNELPGSLAWFFNNNGASGSGLKRVGVPLANDWISFSNAGSYASKFDGTPLPSQLSNSTTPTIKDVITLWNNGNLYLDLANSDTGWAENYTPTNAEVKAFMYGWRMYTAGQDAYANQYNGTGSKGWAKIGYSSVGVIPSTGYSTVVPTENGYVGNNKPYSLVYQLRIPRAETISVEGSLSLVEGLNVLEVGSGMVIREKVNPYRDDTAWNINNGSPSSSGFEYNTSLTKQRIDKFVAIYKNSKTDLWMLYPNNITVAGALAQQSFVAYDPLAVYSVSYLPFDKRPTVNIQFNYAVNEKSTLKELINLSKNTENRVSILENTKEEMDKKLNWIMPTLLNGWVNIPGRPPLAYAVDGFTVRIRGEIKSGVIGSVAFTLPALFRPTGATNASEYIVYSYGQSGVTGASVVIFPDGRVAVQNGNPEQISIGEIQFYI